MDLEDRNPTAQMRRTLVFCGIDNRKSAIVIKVCAFGRSCFCQLRPTGSCALLSPCMHVASGSVTSPIIAGGSNDLDALLGFAKILDPLPRQRCAILSYDGCTARDM